MGYRVRSFSWRERTPRHGSRPWRAAHAPAFFFASFSLGAKGDVEGRSFQGRRGSIPGGSDENVPVFDGLGRTSPPHPLAPKEKGPWWSTGPAALAGCAASVGRGERDADVTSGERARAAVEVAHGVHRH